MTPSLLASNAIVDSEVSPGSPDGQSGVAVTNPTAAPGPPRPSAEVLEWVGSRLRWEKWLTDLGARRPS